MQIFLFTIMLLFSFDTLAMEQNPFLSPAATSCLTQEASGLTKQEVINFLFSLELQPKGHIGVFYENSHLTDLGITFAITGCICAFLLFIPGLMPGAFMAGVYCIDEIARKDCIGFLSTTLAPVGLSTVNIAILPCVAPL